MKILKSTLELKNKLGIDFKDLALLQTAITHSSYANERNTEFNERLEFLGDTVLELIISEYLFTNHIDETEGYLTKVRALIVCENSLFEIAKKWELGKYIYMSKGEELTGGRTRVSILADAVEAIIAAVYLDEGLLVTKEFVLKNFNSIIIKAVKNEIILDYKTKLQEILQKNGDVDISYSLINFEGPPHRRE
ncbi:MAG TPA: ribonuclease III, partial [Clostridium sp.]|nr:ribonuclease III [Clostridium sp.]